MNIKEMVSDNKKVTFLHYKQGELWYSTENNFTFPVPIEDTGEGVFMASDKAIFFLRYIRKHIKSIEEGKKETLAT